jgi:hypothetical protein
VHAQQLDIVLLEERQHTVIEQIGRRDGCLAVVELGKAYLDVGVDEGLLVMRDCDWRLLFELSSLQGRAKRRSEFYSKGEG